MTKETTLADSYNAAEYKIAGHGPRSVQVLKDVFDSLDGSLLSDMYGKGEVIEEFQQRMADLLGKERAVFFPSGTMAQQIALRIWCEEKGLKRVAYHPLCHLEIHEENGLKELHHIESVLLADPERLITLEDVKGLQEDISCLLLELPQREIGGQLPAYEELEAISRYCREQGIRLHLDGARLLEILPYYQRTAAEVCSLFDSVYLSVYKGIGGIAGAVLAGERSFTEASKVWKRRHGGDLISLYPYIITADHYLRQRQDKMGQYYEEAKELAAQLNACRQVSTLPQTPVSSMFHVYFNVPRAQLEPILIQVQETTGVGLIAYLNETGPSTCYSEISLGDRYAGLPKERLRHSLQELDRLLGEF
ncbi:beta-eliminating lyase-related protein [Paenibacillus sp. JX-17]|uniref:Beta-eliminating lyase-related protein n=1 Tax=Paenibacillus lacisoli TaxID=3064525 RepID=A0ABT9CFY1_9BACL|nr:beta-eliminating lyase-related protein [Paenibacillus sp. JX-17]MDO7908189.1 beta-eliminating lyase-related protein [Paenibacillus sp. JX-17]